MQEVSRGGVIIWPTQVFVDWLNALPGIDEPVLLEEARLEPSVYLIPAYESDQEAFQYLASHYEAIAEIEIHTWNTDEDIVPKNLDYALFRQWFHIVLAPMVYDFFDDQPANN